MRTRVYSAKELKILDEMLYAIAVTERGYLFLLSIRGDGRWRALPDPKRGLHVLICPNKDCPSRREQRYKGKDVTAAVVQLAQAQKSQTYECSHCDFARRLLNLVPFW